jgi:ATP/maltotriose-dependent transcriptional regulator MalT
LFERLPPSIEQAKAWYSYGQFMFIVEGRGDVRRAAITRALDVAEAAGATGVAASVQMGLAHEACGRGHITEGLALVERARKLAQASGDAETLVEVAGNESEILLKLGRFDQAAEAGLRGVRFARESGRHTGFDAVIAVSNAAEALLAGGRTGEAVALIDPVIDEMADPEHYAVHGLRARIDLLRGNLEAAAARLRQIKIATGGISSIDDAREIAQLTAEVAVWSRRPADGVAEVKDALARYQSTDWTIQCGWLLAVGMRACADLAEQGRARRDQSATQAALSTVGDLDAWVERMGGNPFVDHPYVATIPAERATWEAERSRLSGIGDPAAWLVAADAWAVLRFPHRAAYARWRYAESRLLAGEPPAAVASTLREAAAAADGHIPLQRTIHALADRARIPLDSAASAPAELPADTTLYGLTERELLVLDLLVAGRSNSEIGAELFISRKTASVHVSNILRKLGVSNRAQAAALAERAGLVSTSLTPLAARRPR